MSNVFEDLGLKDSGELLIKADIASLIYDEISSMKQKDAAKILGINQQSVSRLKNGKLGGFSVKRLLRFLKVLGVDVTIKVTRK